MDDSAITEMAAAEDSHWWFGGTRDVVCDLLLRHLPAQPSETSIADIGCGTGYTMSRLHELGFKVSGCDDSKLAIEYTSGRNIGNVSVQDARHLDFADEEFDALVCLDVLEHIDDHKKAAAELLRILKPGGIAVIAVPAWQILFGPHDKALGHHRRYRLGELRRLLTDVGFEHIYSSYYNSLLFPLIAPIRLIQRFVHSNTTPSTDVSLPPRFINSLLRQLLGFEKKLLRLTNLPLGISAIIVLRK